jgi:glutamate-1-semialdehyde 2,1-aminomutase
MTVQVAAAAADAAAGAVGVRGQAGSLPAAEILARAADIAARPVPRLRPERLAGEHAEFGRRTPRSAALFQRARGVLARGTEHVDPLSSPYPLFLDHGRGSRVVDVDGNSYVDCILAGGALVLGHNDPALSAAVMELLRTRTGFHGHLDEFEVRAAEQICEMFPAAESVRFVGSGAEANLAAARIARAFTGRTKVVKFRGHYHGWGDQFMVDLEVPGSGDFMAGGVPREHYANTVLVTPQRLDELEAALATRDVAAVICEPFGGESGLVPFPDDFHAGAIAMAHKYGALYIFDEVVTGTRAGIGGAQAALGVLPDLFTLGKGLMNGYPSCGAVAGRKEIIDAAATGLPDGSPFTYIGGTMSGNVLSAAACYHTLVELARPGVLDGAIAVTANLVCGLNELFQSAGVPFFAYHFGTILRIELTAPHALPVRPDLLSDIIERRAVLADYMVPVANAGVLSRMGRDMLSCAHTPEDSEKVINAYARLIELLG